MGTGNRFCRALLLCALAVGIVACAANNPLSQQDIAALRIVDVSIAFKSDARVTWPAAEQDFLAETNARNPKMRFKAKAPDHLVETGGVQNEETIERQKLIESPEGREYVRKKAAGLIEKHVRRDVVPRLQGNRDARLEVVVSGFFIPDAVWRATLGGAPILLTVTTIKDARTGLELAKLDDGASTYAGQGIVGALVDQAIASPLEERIVDAYVANLLRWLLKT